MLELIKEIINTFGGRIAGSYEEVAAQHLLREKLDAFCTAETHEFDAAVDAKIESLKIFSLVHVFGLILYWVSIPTAVTVTVLNFVVFLMHFVMYRDWLDPVFPTKRSLNVIGTLEPQKEATSTIIISGHIDSVYEYKWWYILGEYGGFAFIFAGAQFLLYPIFLVVSSVFLYHGESLFTISNTLWLLLSFTSLSLIVYVNFYNKKIRVPGAIDNLSGVAIAYDAVRAFADEKQKGKSRLERTRLRFISFGCEEPGLKGSRAFVRDNLGRLKNENTVILNYDGIKESSQIQIIEMELCTLALFPKMMTKRLNEAFDRAGVEHRYGIMPIGATDATSFQAKGIPAVSVLGIRTDKLDPTYHTREDVPENLDPESLEGCKKATIEFIREWDKHNVFDENNKLTTKNTIKKEEK